MAAPEEVVAGSSTIYVADVGTAFPKIDDAVADFAVDWASLGTEGSLNYGDTGVTLALGETTSPFTPAGSIRPTKYWRTGQTVQFSVNLVDTSAAAFAKVMGDAAVTTVAPGTGTAGEDSFSLALDTAMTPLAVLVRGPSPHDNTMNQQFEFSTAYVSVSGNAVWKNGTPVSLPVTIMVAKATSDAVMINRIQTADAS